MEPNYKYILMQAYQNKFFDLLCRYNRFSHIEKVKFILADGQLHLYMKYRVYPEKVRGGQEK